MSLTIYGASDDLIEVEGSIREEFQCYSGNGEITIASSDGAMRVFLRLEANGCWSAGVGQIDEGARLPWLVAFGRPEHCAYSVAVTVDCPADAQIHMVEL